MEVEQGFKQTEVGIIPKDWNIFPISEIFQFLRTGNNTRSELTDNGEYNYIHYGDIHTKWKGFLDCQKEIIPFIDKNKVKHLPNLEEGDLIIADASEDYEGLGVSTEIKNIKDKFIVAGLHTLLARGNKSLIADGYKGYLQELNWFKNSIIKVATGISVFGLSKTNLKSISLPLPPLPEQCGIAETLSDVDALITAQDALIAKKRAIKQGVMQELITGKRRLPGFNGEWKIMKLADVCDLQVGRRPKGGVTEEGDIPSLGGENILNNYGLNLSSVKKVSEAFFMKMTKGILQENDVLINKDGANTGKIAIYSNSGFIKACINEHLFILRGKPNINNHFLYYSLSLEKHMAEIKKLIASSAQPGLNRKFINQISIAFPKFEEQKGIGELLSNIDNEILLLEQKRDKTKALKQGMMQELLTGRIRLMGE